jgi:hypothetical protein
VAIVTREADYPKIRFLDLDQYQPKRCLAPVGGTGGLVYHLLTILNPPLAGNKA